MKAFLAAGVWFTAAVVLVVGSVVALSWIGFLDQISILFYRGLVLIAVGVIFCFAVLLIARAKWPSWHIRDAVSACAFAGGIAICLLIVLPVTIDRSISVFTLTQMAAQPDHAFTPSELRSLSVDVYVKRYGQIERRLEEQEVSRNVAQTEDGFRITPQGLAFVRFARFLSVVFQTDRRFVTPAQAAVPASPAAVSPGNGGQ